MTEVDGQTGGRLVDEPEGNDWAVRKNAAVRALLDHVAEELAAEFVRLMKASVIVETDAEPDKEKR